MKRRDGSPTGTAHLVFDLARPYRGWFVIILLTMLVEAATGLAGPWPLKIVIDYAVGHQPVAHWVVRLLGTSLAADGMTLASTACGGVVFLAVLGRIPSYVGSYYTESMGQ